MKKIILLACSFLSITFLKAQWSGGTDIYNTAGGNVSVGTSFPLSKFTVNGNGISLTNGGNGVFLNGNVTATSGNNWLQLACNSNTSNGASILLWNTSDPYSYKNGSVDLCSYGITGHSIRFVNYNPTTGFWTDNMVLTKDGKLMVGYIPSTPGNYKLYVENGIMTERVKVAYKNTSDWSDYVFKKGYKLMPLDRLEQYIATFSHLPGIPSASEVVKEGSDLGEMDAKLLARIEELTLYIIELNKKMEQQQKEIEQIKRIRKN